MNLTVHFVEDSRRAIADVEAVDITNPDLPRPTGVRLIVRLTETLRSLSDHAERLAQSNTKLRAERTEFKSQAEALRAEAPRPLDQRKGTAMPELHGRELSPGDELGLDAVPDCCDAAMTPDGRNFTCGSCWTVLTVNSLGLVADIH